MACGATLSLKRTLEFDSIHTTPRQKRRRCEKLTTMTTAAAPTRYNQINASPFSEVFPQYTTEQINASLTSEIKRMQRRRKLTYNADCRQYLGNSPPGSPALSSSPPCSPSSGTSSPVLMDSSSTPSTSTSYKHHHHHHRRLSGDAPLFTQKQVSIVCEKLIRDREEQIKEQYDKILTSKLAEQYEAFLKFNQDQLHRRFQESAASYVS